MITPTRLRELEGLIAKGRHHMFYSWPEWLSVRGDVLRADHFECQHCKAHGRYARAELVHHVQHLDSRPDLALSLVNPENGERQLVSLCRPCHELCHPERMRRTKNISSVPLTIERWD